MLRTKANLNPIVLQSKRKVNVKEKKKKWNLVWKTLCSIAEELKINILNKKLEIKKRK